MTGFDFLRRQQHWHQAMVASIFLPFYTSGFFMYCMVPSWMTATFAAAG
jgi:hypothetical protein